MEWFFLLISLEHISLQHPVVFLSPLSTLCLHLLLPLPPLSLRSQTYSLLLFYILVLFLCNRIWSIYLLSAASSSSISMLLLIVHGLFRNLLLFLHLLSYFSIFYSPACSQSDSCVFHPVSSMYTIFFLVVRTTYSLFLTHLKRRTLPVFPQLHFVRPIHICRVLHSFPYCLLPLLR